MSPANYLLDRVAEILVYSDKKQNEGCRLLRLWDFHDDESQMEQLCLIAWQKVLQACIGRKDALTKGGKLTALSESIGRAIIEQIQDAHAEELDPLLVRHTIPLGDLFLEAFLQADRINISREYKGIRAPYRVTLVGQDFDFTTKLTGTVFKRPGKVTTAFSPITKGSYIKGYVSPARFLADLEANPPYIQCLNKVRQQGFKLNLDALELLEQHPAKRTIELIDAEGELFEYDILSDGTQLPKRLKHYPDMSPFLGATRDPRVVRMRSKYYEYKQILLKAQLVLAEFERMDVPPAEGVFWQEVFFDYRGRLYYSEPFFNFQGSDQARALFLFEERAPVTAEAEKALWIHAANCFGVSLSIKELTEAQEKGLISEPYTAYLKRDGLDSIGLDKLSLDDKVRWMQEWVASHPVIDFQEKAEKPFSLMAVLWVLHECLFDGRNTTDLPTPIDGSNNGWQHLAAMSRDEEAGALVSLVDSNIQKDFYTTIAKVLKHKVPAWFSEKEIPLKHIRKGITKRGAMTRAYSAGRRRIGINMYDDCHAEGLVTTYGISEEDCQMLAQHLIEAVNQVCQGPLRVMKYLQKLALLELSSGHRQGLTWTTPSGFPVIYRVWKTMTFKYKGTIRGIPNSKDNRINHVLRRPVTNPETKERVPDMKSFAAGISPNFVHSMDSSHLHLVCSQMTSPFAGIHDSYSTTPGESEELKALVKEEFINLYDTKNFLSDIKFMLLTDPLSGKGLEPPLGSLRIQDVRYSTYFFC